MPLALLQWFAPDRWRTGRTWRFALLGLAAAWFGATFFVAVAEHFFLEEFDSRFSLVAVDYLICPTEVAGDIWTEYPVKRALAVTSTVAVLATCALR